MMPVYAQGRAVRNTLLGVVLLVCIGGPLYAYLLSIPAPKAIPLIAAFALEAVFYVAACIEPARKTLETRFRPVVLALWMTASAVAPYFVYTIPTGVWSPRGVALLVLLAAAVSFWYTVLPRNGVVDVAFVVAIGAVVLSPAFASIYASPVPRLRLAILGQLMWTRLAIFEALAIGGMRVQGFGLIPRRDEWAAGAIHFAMFLPVGVALGWATGFGGFHLRPAPWWQTLGVAVATFLGMLWVVGLREEFFVRGLLQEWLSRWVKSDVAAIVVASVAFGAAHLPFRGFPNWRFALLATVAGLFYGRAYATARSVRAAMVAHALVNTVWRVFFS